MRAGVSAALKGDFRFWQEILNRLDGKVPDRMAGANGEEVIIEHRLVKVEFDRAG